MQELGLGVEGEAARVALLDDVVRSAAHEPDAAQVRAHNEQLRRDGYVQIVGHLDGRFGLLAGLDPADAVDILLTLAGPASASSTGSRPPSASNSSRLHRPHSRPHAAEEPAAGPA